MLGDKAHLSRGRPLGIANQHAFDQTFPRQCGLQFGARLVLANQPDEDAARAERGDVARDVADAEHRLADNRMRKSVKIEHRNSLSVAPSAETIGGIEETLDVSLDSVFQRGESAVVTGAA